MSKYIENGIIFESEITSRELTNIKARLREFLTTNYRLLRAMRARWQVAEHHIPYDQIKELDKFIDENGGDKIDSWNPCQFSEDYFVLDHPNQIAMPKFDPKSAVKGFRYYFKYDDQPYEAIVLDSGQSRSFFDRKNAEDKKLFVQKVADFWPRHYAQNGFWQRIPDFFNPRNMTMAFLTDNGKELLIEEIVKESTPTK